VAAEHHDDCALVAMGAYDRVDDRPEIGGDENVGQCVEKSPERPVATRGRRELPGSDLVRATLDRDGADLRQIRFGSPARRARAGITRLSAGSC
jgi:hypothetical protein